ncbi:MAG: hypothetical protein ACOCWH_07275, partial [Spirochaetota bacterium]
MKLNIHSLQFRLTVTFILISALPVIIVIIIAWFMTGTITRDNTLDSAKNGMIHLDQTIEVLVSEYTRDTIGLASLSTVTGAAGISSYTDTDGTVGVSPLQRGGSDAAIYTMFDDFAQSREEIRKIVYAEQDGGYVQWPAGEIDAPFVPSEDIPYFSQTLSGEA